MTSQQVPLTDPLLDYLLEVSDPLPRQIQIAIETAVEMDRPSMQVAPDQAVLLRFLLRLIGARRVLEIGTFLGLSATVIAEAVGPEGRVTGIDVSPEIAEEWTNLFTVQKAIAADPSGGALAAMSQEDLDAWAGHGNVVAAYLGDVCELADGDG